MPLPADKDLSSLKLEDEQDATLDKRHAFQSMFGKLMYAMLGTRPDIAYFVGKLARFSHNPLIQY